MVVGFVLVRSTSFRRVRSGAFGIFPFGCVQSIPEHLGGAFAVHYSDSPFPGVVGLVIVRSENSLAPRNTSGRFACAQIAHGFNADTKKWNERTPTTHGNGAAGNGIFRKPPGICNPTALERTQRPPGSTGMARTHSNEPDEPKGER